MSLRVWLPLNGDTHNQGLMQLPTPTVNTFTFSNGGKIGGQSTSGSGKIAWHLTEDFLSNNKWTVATWIKATQTFSSANNIIFCKNTSASNDCQIYFSIVNGTSLVCGVNGPSSSLTTSYTFTVGTWYHVATTYNGSTVALYINGEQKATKTVTTAWPGEKLNMQLRDRSNNAAGTGSGGSAAAAYAFNDFRIYDHALSELEIKEIARAKVLHYPLNHNGYGMPNLLKLGNVQQSGNSQTAHILYWYFDFSGNLPTGTYTLSFDAKTSNGTDNAYVSYANGSSTIVRISDLMAIPSNWKHYTFTFTNAASNCNDIFFTSYKSYGGSTSPNKNNTGYLYVRNVKLENGNKATPFALAASEDTTITEYDISGYCNNGTKIGTFTYSTDTPKYNLSTYINATSTANRIESINDIILPTDGITASLWIKTSSKATNQVLLATSQIEIGLLNSLCYIKTSSAVGFTTTNFINNAWNHMVAVRINDTYKLYINGVEETQSGASNYYLHNKNSLYLFNRSYNNNYAANASLSDVRIYATALSAQDILSLYHNSAFVDEQGIIHGAIH